MQESVCVSFNNTYVTLMHFRKYNSNKQQILCSHLKMMAVIFNKILIKQEKLSIVIIYIQNHLSRVDKSNQQTHKLLKNTTLKGLPSAAKLLY